MGVIQKNYIRSGFRINRWLSHFLRDFQAFADDVHIWLWCCDAALALFMEHMQHANRLPELDSVYNSIRAALVIIHDLQYTRAPKSFSF